MPGVQIQNLAVSTQARARGLKPGVAGWPEAAYNGEYIADIARGYLARETVAARDGEPVQGAGDVEDLDAIRRFAVAWLRHEQDIDLQASASSSTSTISNRRCTRTARSRKPWPG